MQTTNIDLDKYSISSFGPSKWFGKLDLTVRWNKSTWSSKLKHFPWKLIGTHQNDRIIDNEFIYSK